MKNKEEIKQILLKFESDIDNGIGIPNKCIANIDYADLIKDLEKQLTLQWVKVTDRLPEIGQMILVYVPSIDMICRDQYRHFEGINKNSFVYKGVTHWMPLPEPPEV